MVIAFALVITSSCSDDKAKDEKTKTEKKTDEKVDEPIVEEPAFIVSEEMNEFLGMFDGTFQKVEEGLAKFGATDEIKEDEMGMYDMSEPTVTSAEGDCYVFEAKAGMTKRIYKVCWTDGLISGIEFIEMI